MALIIALLWVLTLLRALSISVNTTHPKILRQSRLKWETKINWRDHKFFSKNWVMKYLALWSSLLQNVFWKIWKTLRPLPPPFPRPSNILNAHFLSKQLKFLNDRFNIATSKHEELLSERSIKKNCNTPLYHQIIQLERNAVYNAQYHRGELLEFNLVHGAMGDLFNSATVPNSL